MDNYIPCGKLSRKEKRKLDAAKRTAWGSLNPAPRSPQNSNAYNRRKAQGWKKEFPNAVLSFYHNDKKDSNSWDLTVNLVHHFGSLRIRMLKQSDYAVTYIPHPWGSTCQYMQTAIRSGKEVVSISDALIFKSNI